MGRGDLSLACLIAKLYGFYGASGSCKESRAESDFKMLPRDGKSGSGHTGTGPNHRIIILQSQSLREESGEEHIWKLKISLLMSDHAGWRGLFSSE